MADAAGGSMPLRGKRIIELGQVITAPYVGLLLADLGAEVIKIEGPPEGDSARNTEVTPMHGVSATFATFNRNKQSLLLDLTRDEDYAVFADLVRTADVVVGNMTPRVARKLRVDRDSLSALNPSVISCSIQGHRSEQPQSDEPSFDLVHQALAGYMLLEGNPLDPPLRIGIPLGDLAAGLFAVYAILAALVERAESGQGEAIEIPMYDSLLSLLTYTATLYLNTGKQPQRMGSAHEYTAPWQAYRASDGDLVVAVRSQRFWTRLCSALDRPQWLADERFATVARRLENRAALQDLLEDLFRDRTRADVVGRLAEAGVPAAVVRTVGEALDEVVAQGSDLIQEMDDPLVGAVRIVGNPVRFRRMHLAEPTAAPGLDEHGARETEDRLGVVRDER